MPTATETFRKFKLEEVDFPPLDFMVENTSVKVGGFEVDAILSASWDGQPVAKFAAEYKSTGTPKAMRSALGEVGSWGLGGALQPLVIAPFLNEERLREFERARVSAMDLCGNGIIFIDQCMFVYRTGGQNQFKSNAPIKNIYRRKTSLVPRVFLSRPTFDSVQQIRDVVNQRDKWMQCWDGKATSLSTVSKAIRSMEEELLIQRGNDIGLIQPEKLLNLLSENYQQPESCRQIRVKLPVEDDRVMEVVRREALRLGMPWSLSGLSSVSRYAVMQRGEMVSVYCPRVDQLLAGMDASETNRFPNLELIECEDERMYFDCNELDGIPWASPVQTYLELMQGDKRDRETAQQVASFILTGLERRSK